MKILRSLNILKNYEFEFITFTSKEQLCSLGTVIATRVSGFTCTGLGEEWRSSSAGRLSECTHTVACPSLTTKLPLQII